MNKITFGLFAFFALLLLSACEALSEDARDTPIGSVLSGETRDADGYVEKVKERNQTSNRDLWRPENPGNGDF